MDVALIAAPAGGQSAGAHLVASPDTRVGLQAVVACSVVVGAFL